MSTKFVEVHIEPYRPTIPQARSTAARYLQIGLLVLLASFVVGFTWLSNKQLLNQEAQVTNLRARFSELENFCSHVPSLGEEEFIARRQRLATLLKASNFTAFVAEPGSTLDYLVGATSWSLSERPFLLVVKADDPVRVTFFAPKFEAIRARERTSVVRGSSLVFWEEDESVYNSVVRFTSTSGPAVFAVDPAARSFIFDGIRTASTANPRSLGGAKVASAIVSPLRAIKSKAEIEILRCANEATKAAIEMVARTVVVHGITEKEVSSFVSEAHRAAGLDHAFALVLFGPNAASPHGVGGGSKVLQPGELVLIDAGAKLYGYESDVTRTFAPIGTEPTERQKQIWKVVRDAQAAAIAKAKPNAVAEDLDKAARDLIINSGFPPEAFSHRLGHGIGLQGHEDYYLVHGNKVKLPASTTFSVEPGIYLEDDIGVRIEDIAVLTEDGVEILGKMVGEELEFVWG